MRREVHNEEQLRRAESRLGGSIAIGIALGAALGLVVDNIAIGIALGLVLGVGIGCILAQQCEEARAKLGDPNEQRVVALIISFATFLLFLWLLWWLMTGF